ncbi:putative phage tail protein [Clostridium perfringens]|uniref:putative phage tail protein n=1 Tax=Clostridium perfringens TaxID=1502 RepID=UPI00399C6F04
MIDIKPYFPLLYENILEIDTLVEAENYILDELNTEINRVKDNEYIVTADKETIKRYEILLRITDGDDKDLEFRRQRVLNRLSMNMPFTLRALKQKLNELIGKGNYVVSVDNENYTLVVESKILNQVWFNETYITVNKMKPANIVFINKPFIDEKILVNEEISLSQREYNYRLGTTWRLGIKPFKTLNEKGVIKLKENKSITNYFVDEMRNFIISKISYIKLNDTKVINEFITKDVIGGRPTIEYAVSKEWGLGEITKVDIYTSDDNLLTTVNLYVPIIEDLELKHVINVEEGVNQ